MKLDLSVLDYTLTGSRTDCWTVALNQVRFGRWYCFSTLRRSRHDVPGMCLKQRRGRGRKYLEEKLVLRLRRPRRPRIDGRVSQKVRGVSALSNW